MGRIHEIRHLQQRQGFLWISMIFMTMIVERTNSMSITQTQTQAQKPIQHVAIIGSGISGLSVAHALTNSKGYLQDTDTDSDSDFDVQVFDRRPGLDVTAGAGIQLNGGLAVLGQINPNVQQAVMAAGLPQTRVQSRAKSWFHHDNHDENNNNLFDTLLEINLKETVQARGGKVAASLIMEQEQELLWTSIMRGALQQTLYDTLPHNHRIVNFSKELVAIDTDTDTDVSDNDSDKDSGSVYCVFADGSKAGPFDLVVGCDGIKSVVKDYVADTQQVQQQEATTTTEAAIYSGLRIRYAVAEGDPTKQKEEFEASATLSQYFGDGAYALHGIYGAGPGKPNTQCVFIVYLDEDYIGPFQKKKKSSTTTTTAKKGTSKDGPDENTDWSQDNRMSLEASKQTMMEQLRTCCGIPPSREDHELVQTIQKADRFFELGSYFHNPFGRWHRKLNTSKDCSNGNAAHVVLCGDAAHALPPFLGQGSNQAIQDAYCLAKQLYTYNAAVRSNQNSAATITTTATTTTTITTDLSTLLDEYEHTRWPATFGIFWKAAFLGYLETGGFDGVYAKFRDVLFRIMGIVGVAQRVLLGAAVPKV